MFTHMFDDGGTMFNPFLDGGRPMDLTVEEVHSPAESKLV